MSQTRAYCQQCFRPAKACICHCVLPVKHHVKINILQHVKEQTQAKGTAKLADLCLQQCELSVFDPKLPFSLADREVAVLFPSENADVLTSTASEYINACGGLIILDGTWRQANQLVQAIESQSIKVSYYALPAQVEETAYAALRKTKKTAAFSTIEAISKALSILEPNNHDMLNLNKAFVQFVAFQTAFRQ